MTAAYPYIAALPCGQSYCFILHFYPIASQAFELNGQNFKNSDAFEKIEIYKKIAAAGA